MAENLRAVRCIFFLHNSVFFSLRVCDLSPVELFIEEQIKCDPWEGAPELKNTNVTLITIYCTPQERALIPD